jgi:hypothetical protein
MKKISIVFLVLLLVCAGMAIMSCPSDPIPPLKDPDIEIKGGKFQFDLNKPNDPRIEDGKEYQIIFTIEDCDPSFIDIRLGGKICYKMDLDSEDEKILSGWDYAVPPMVNASIKEYVWTFKAGAANKDDKPIADPATTPENGKQYFSFTAQKGWNDSKNDFNVKGKFEIKSREIISEWESAGTVTLGSGDGHGTLSADDMAKILALPPRSKIKFTIEVNVNLTGSTKPGNGICGIGGWHDNDSLSIAVPAGTSAGEQTFTAELEIADILRCQPAGAAINVNPYNGAKVTNAELFKPKTN